jgi:hypothetical protein
MLHGAFTDKSVSQLAEVLVHGEVGGCFLRSLTSPPKATLDIPIEFAQGQSGMPEPIVVSPAFEVAIEFTDRLFAFGARVISRNYDNLSQTVLSNSVRARYEFVVALDAHVSANANNRKSMKILLNYVIILSTLLAGNSVIASETRVIINLADQLASLVQQDRITLVSPIASGKLGWSTPTVNFKICDKDINHHSRSFGLVVDASGRVLTQM